MSTLLQIDNRDRAQALGDVVFVHGLGGKAAGTWKNRRGGLWPKWVALEREELSVWTFGYRNPIFGRGVKDLCAQAKDLLECMYREGLGDRPLCLVGHSRGGLLIEEAVRTGEVDSRYRRILDELRGVVFLATPFLGSRMASVARWFPLTSTAIRELHLDNPELSELLEYFRGQVTARRLELLIFKEGQATAIGKVVGNRSADPGFWDSLAVAIEQADHSAIVKPRDETSPIYKSVARFLANLFAEHRLQALVAEFPPPLVRAADPYDHLGVTRSTEIETYADRDERPPYVDRLRDNDIREALTGHRAVLVSGPSKSGKSRTAYEALLPRPDREWPGWPEAQLLIPQTPADLPQLLSALQRMPAANRHAVLWLDDLERYVMHVTYPDLATFVAVGDCMVVATIRSVERKRILEASGELRERAKALLGWFRQEVVLPRLLTAEEKQAAEAAYPDLDLSPGIGVALIAGRQVADRFDDSDGTQPQGQTLVRALIDWQRVGVPSATSEQLRELYAAYLAQLRPLQKPTADSFGQALDWARREILHNVALVLPQSADPELLHVHDYLVEHVDERRPDLPILESAWEIAIARSADPNVGMTSVGYRALLRGLPDTAMTAWRQGMDVGEIGAAVNLGILLKEQGDTKGAIEAYRTAIELGYGGAASNLGVLLKEQGDTKGAIDAYCTGIGLGDGGAAYNLGILLKEQGDTKRAIEAYRTGIELGYGGAAYNLGVLLKEQGDTKCAIEACRHRAR